MTGDGVNVRTQSTATSPQVQQLAKGDTVTATTTVANGFRQLVDGDWVLDGYLTPTSRHNLRLRDAEGVRDPIGIVTAGNECCVERP